MDDRYIVEEHPLPGVGSVRGAINYQPAEARCWRVVDSRTGDRLDGIHETPEEAIDRAAALNERLA